MFKIQSVPEEINPTEKPLEIKEDVSQPVEEKHWLKPLLFLLLGVVVATAFFFAGYQLGQKQAQLVTQPTPTPVASPTPVEAGSYRIAGIDLTIDKALRVERDIEKDLLVLSVTFAANEECPLPGGAVCGYDTRRFRLVDDERYVQDMLFSYPTIEYLTTNPISQRILKLGEKDRGEVFFEISKEKNKFFLTYSLAGETTEQILIEPELFDPSCVEKETGDEMTLSEAKEIALKSECAEEGNLTGRYFCNENTGTWWLDLDIDKPGCAPACVVDVSTGEAEINWRCTGLIPE